MTSRGKISTAFAERAIDKTRCVIAVVLPEPAEATTEKFRWSSLAKRSREAMSANVTIFPSPLFRVRGFHGCVATYLPKFLGRLAVPRADRRRCNQTPVAARLSCRRCRFPAWQRDRQRHWCAARDRRRTIVAR